MFERPKVEFGKKYPKGVKECVKYILKNYPGVLEDKTSNTLIIAYWIIWNNWDKKENKLPLLTPIETITRARRELGL